MWCQTGVFASESLQARAFVLLAPLLAGLAEKLKLKQLLVRHGIGSTRQWEFVNKTAGVVYVIAAASYFWHRWWFGRYIETEAPPDLLIRESHRTGIASGFILSNKAFRAQQARETTSRGFSESGSGPELLTPDS